MLVFWLFLVILLDGYDLVVYGAIVPSLIKEWGISDVAAGAIGSYTAIGLALGGFIFGILSDRIGRKRIII
jgi:AAHS family benzoate transporter-like MFS transporter